MKNIMIWIMLLLSITYTDAQNGKSPRKDYAKLANYDEKARRQARQPPLQRSAGCRLRETATAP